MAQTKRAVSRNLIDASPNAAQDAHKSVERSELLPGSALFPKKLHELKDVPKKLYALGNIDALTQPAIAIVGARKATPYGLECAERFARIAAAQGIAIVSGGAIGCDMAAHRGALDAGGTTIVVLGSGADVVYPLRARSLFWEILDAGGLLLSEAPWGSAPLSWAFSRRNRIIAALTEATLIVEAGLPSGTFQTADHTLALGNEVLVVPGPIFSKGSKGSNRLLVQGALPVVDDESFKDTLSQVFGLPGPQQGFQYALSLDDVLQSPAEDNRQEVAGKKLAPQELKQQQLKARLIDDLGANPMTIDALAHAYGKSVIELIRCVTELEVSGYVERLRDGRYMTSIQKQSR